MMLAALILLCLATGIAGVLDIQQRRAELAGISERGQPLTGAAVEIYRSLSDADATAAGAFLLGGLEPQELREQYQKDIIEAGKALSMAAATGQNATTVAELTAYLPLYNGLVETARSYNRQGLPQGAAFLREASFLAQQIMLPKADNLYRAETARLAEAQQRASAFPVAAVAIGGLTLGALVAAQLFLARSTRRILNAGLLAATLATLGGVVWLGIASASSAGHGSTSRTEGTAAVEAFAEARIQALQARGDEALTLVARGNGQDYENRFHGNKSELDGLLPKVRAAASQNTAGHVEAAISAWRQWLSSHEILRGTDDSGDYNGAVRSATSPAEGSTRTLSTKVDDELGAAIAGATARFASETADATRALATADVGVMTLLVLAILGLLWGFAPRLREFR